MRLGSCLCGRWFCGARFGEALGEARCRASFALWGRAAARLFRARRPAPRCTVGRAAVLGSPCYGGCLVVPCGAGGPASRDAPVDEAFGRCWARPVDVRGSLCGGGCLVAPCGASGSAPCDGCRSSAGQGELPCVVRRATAVGCSAVHVRHQVLRRATHGLMRHWDGVGRGRTAQHGSLCGQAPLSDSVCGKQSRLSCVGCAARRSGAAEASRRVFTAASLKGVAPRVSVGATSLLRR